MTSIISENDNRKIQRYPLALPAKVEVQIDNNFSWNEVCRLGDISAFGAGFTINRPVKRGRLVKLTMPMPRQLRCYDFLEPQYQVWGLVMRCLPLGDNPAATTFGVGVAFIGKEPPASYNDNPAALYQLKDRAEEVDTGLWEVFEADKNPDESNLPPHLRRHTRFQIPESLILELLDENGNVAASEVSVTENLSLSGASVFTSFRVDVGGFLRVKSESRNVSIISIIRGRHSGADGIVRLHLEFIDRFFPIEGVE